MLRWVETEREAEKLMSPKIKKELEEEGLRGRKGIELPKMNIERNIDTNKINKMMDYIEEDNSWKTKEEFVEQLLGWYYGKSQTFLRNSYSKSNLYQKVCIGYRKEGMENIEEVNGTLMVWKGNKGDIKDYKSRVLVSYEGIYFKIGQMIEDLQYMVIFDEEYLGIRLTEEIKKVKIQRDILVAPYIKEMVEIIKMNTN